MSKITVMGLGSMGSRMAINYAKAGHEVAVWNRTIAVAHELATSHDLAVASTPRLAVEGADFVVSMVSDDNAALELWADSDHGALAAIDHDAIAIESSTLTPGAVQLLSQHARAAQVRFVEAPVVGSRPQAEAGALFYLLGGPDDVVEAARAIIDVNAGGATHVGEIGNAATLKLAINGLFAAQVAAYAEVSALLERSDVDSATAFETLAALPITSPGLQRILGLIDKRDYEPNFPVHLVAKDLEYLASVASDTGAKVPMIDAAKSVFEDGAAGPERQLDIAGIAQRYEQS